MNKVTNAVAKIGKKSAVKNSGFFCMFWMHQPKVPAKLLAMKNHK